MFCLLCVCLLIPKGICIEARQFTKNCFCDSDGVISLVIICLRRGLSIPNVSRR